MPSVRGRQQVLFPVALVSSAPVLVVGGGGVTSLGLEPRKRGDVGVWDCSFLVHYVIRR